MSDDIVTRLRNDVCLFSKLDWQGHVALAREAADEIERQPAITAGWEDPDKLSTLK